MSATLPAHTDAVRRPRRSLRFVRDDELVRLVRAGDEGAFEAIYDRHARGILSFCRHMLGSREEAEDAVQHTFASAFRDLSGSRKPIQLKAWLYTIARNRSLSILRARREERALDDVPEPSVEGLSTQVQRRQDLRDLLSDLHHLPEDQRAALVLAELGALSHEEIAVTLDVRKDKVKALVFQARESLASARQARDADCREIQEQLSVLRGGSLRRTELRRHIAVCPACTAFKAEVQRQRAAMAIVLPVAPTVALKESALAAAAAAAATGAGAGSAALGGGAAGGGLLAAVGAKSLAAKVIAIAAVAGAATGGGLMAVDELSTAPADDSPPRLAVAPDPGSAVRMVAALRERASRVAEQREADAGGGAAGAATDRDGQRDSGRDGSGDGGRPGARRDRDAGTDREDGPRAARDPEGGSSGPGPDGGRDDAAASRPPAANDTGASTPAVASPGRNDGARDDDDGDDRDDGDDGDDGRKVRKTKPGRDGRRGAPFPTPRRGSAGRSPAIPPGQIGRDDDDRAPGEGHEKARGNGHDGRHDGDGDGDDGPRGKARAAVAEAIDTLPPDAAVLLQAVLPFADPDA